MQVQRAMRKGAQVFIAIVRKADDSATDQPPSTTAGSAASQSTAAATHSSTAGLVPKHKLDASLKRYDCVFMNLPGGRIERPSIQDMTIELESGKSPPVGVT